MGGCDSSQLSWQLPGVSVHPLAMCPFSHWQLEGQALDIGTRKGFPAITPVARAEAGASVCHSLRLSDTDAVRGRFANGGWFVLFSWLLKQA